MISFGILTSTPAVVRDFLVARGVMEIEDGELVGVRPGVEWVETPNTIATGGSGTEGDPWVYDTRRLFHIKVAHEAEAFETEGEAQTDAEGNPRLIWTRTKLGKWIAANSAAVNATDAMGRQFRGRKVTGQQIWLIREDDMAQLHAWQ